MLNEREFAQCALQNNVLSAKPSDTLIRVARYLHAEGYQKPDIRRRLEEFILKADPAANIVKWQPAIEHYTRDADKYPLLEIDSIGITSDELICARAAGGKPMQRLLFTLISLAKYANAANANNNNWVNRPDKEVFRLANIQTSTRKQAFMIHDLRSEGFVAFGKKVDNVNLQVSCLHEQSPVVVALTDFRNLGYQYMRYLGEPYFDCRECGITTRRKAPNQKYCPDCAAEANRQKTLQRWYEGQN